MKSKKQRTEQNHREIKMKCEFACIYEYVGLTPEFVGLLEEGFVEFFENIKGD